MADVPGMATFTNTPEQDKIRAETEYRQAQAEYFKAQAQGQVIDNRTAAALATSAEIALGRERFKDRWEQASNGRHRSFHFTDEINSDTVEAAVDILNRWQRLDKDDQNPWRFVICSAGGDVIYGMKLYSTLLAIASKRPLITVASGICASMATIIHQTGTERIIEPGCSYMIHDVSGGSRGSVGQMQDTMEWMGKLNRQLHLVLANRSGMSIDTVADMAKRRDVWFMPEEVVEMNLADRIGFAAE